MNNDFDRLNEVVDNMANIEAKTRELASDYQAKEKAKHFAALAAVDSVTKLDEIELRLSSLISIIDKQEEQSRRMLFLAKITLWIASLTLAANWCAVILALFIRKP